VLKVQHISWNDPQPLDMLAELGIAFCNIIWLGPAVLELAGQRTAVPRCYEQVTFGLS
jgi:hypothetical protein